MAGRVDVAIIGAGPAGLSAACELQRLGVGTVTVLEREREAGGIPRHCGHPPFGLREFGRLLTGPQYARRLVEAADRHGATIRCQTTVIRMEQAEGGVTLSMTTPSGPETLHARRVLIATGTRETPRSARLLSGERPLGVINTGALQSYAYLEGGLPFRRPIIVGTELVALSAILTCRGMGARPVAMIEEKNEVTARKPLFLYPRLLGIPVMTGTRIVDIAGNPRVTHVVLERDGRTERLHCDGVILTGCFTAENHLARLSGLEIDPLTGGPVIDDFGRSSMDGVFAAGNLLRPVETAGWCFREGRAIARTLYRDLADGLPPRLDAARLHIGPGLRYAVPQRLSDGRDGLDRIQLRLERPFDGWLVARDGNGQVLARSRLRNRPERRILLPAAPLAAAGDIDLTLEDK